MKKYICFIEHEGFLLCDPNGKYIRTFLESARASELPTKKQWEKWLADHPTLHGTILERV